MTGDYLPTRTTYEFNPPTLRQRVNRARLNAVIAQGKPAIEAPRGCFNLSDVGIVPAKPKVRFGQSGPKPEPKEIEPMNETAAVHTNGASAATAVATPHNTRKPPTDERIRAMHAEYMAGSTIRDIATKYHTSNATLSKHFARLGLEVRPVGFRNSGKKFDKATKGDHHPDTRQPYTPPTITAVPLNGDGPHAETAREMVAEHVGAQTPAQTAVTIAEQEPLHTAVSFGRMAFLVESLQAMGVPVEVHGEINIKISF